MHGGIRVRNLAIDLYKFIFCCIIATLHFYKGSSAPHMVGGGVGVEFFVMAAGLFFFRKLERETAAPNGGMDSMAYIKKRFLRLFPYTTTGLLLAFLWNGCGFTLSKEAHLPLPVYISGFLEIFGTIYWYPWAV